MPESGRQYAVMCWQLGYIIQINVFSATSRPVVLHTPAAIVRCIIPDIITDTVLIIYCYELYYTVITVVYCKFFIFAMMWKCCYWAYLGLMAGI